MVSVFILSWNHEKYVEQAVQSVIDQTYKAIEIIYVDNNSYDNTFILAKNILEKSGINYSVTKRDKHYNIAANLNFMLTKASGDHICIISADDWLHKDNILEQMKVFEANPQLGLVYSGGYKYHQDIKVYEPFKVIRFPDDEVLDELLARNFISAVGYIIRTAILKEIGNWNENYIIEDGDMWVRIVSKYKIAGLDKYLFFYRQHQASITADPSVMLKAKMEWLNSNRHLNSNPQLTHRNNIFSYLSKKVVAARAFSTTLEVLTNFRLNKPFVFLLIKSFLPAALKHSLHKKSLVRKFGKIVPET